LTLTANVTFTFANLGAGRAVTLILIQDGTGSRTATWPAAVNWANGTTPRLSSAASAVDTITLVCRNDGSTVSGFATGMDNQLTTSLYEDLQVSISNIRVPSVNDPTERLYAFGIGGGVTFPVLGFAVNDYLYFDVQTHHAMKLNTALDNHLHFTLPNTTDIGDKFQFQLDVIAAGIDTQWAAPTGTPFTSEHTIVANDNTYHRLMEMADIPANNDTVSTIYKCKLTRIAATGDEYASEVYISFMDCHYQKNTMGSRQEGTK
jgi:hypothetical protein